MTASLLVDLVIKVPIVGGCMCFFDSCKRHLSVKANLHIQDDGLMILCSVCDLWQHAVCYGIMEEDDAPQVHVCVECSKVKQNPLTFPGCIL